MNQHNQTNSGEDLDPRHFVLSVEQQSQLLNALNVPNPMLSQTSMGHSQPSQTASTNPLLDFSYDFNPDTSFDFDFSGEGATLLGEQSILSNPSEGDESPTKETLEKRPLPEDIAADNDASKSAAKKREITKPEKVPKKPGRKPLTEEPTTKRKAQNRAAQRAFRERKEKHVRDLETKVEELEKASAATANENSELKSQIQRLTSDLEAYKKALQKQNVAPRPRGFGASAVSNLPDINFQFDFPRFGSLPGPPSTTHSQNESQSHDIKQSPYAQLLNLSGNSQSSTSSPTQRQNNQSLSADNSAQTQKDLARFSNVFSPSPPAQGQGSSSGQQHNGNGNYGTTSSPSASSNSNPGTISSCGTSPEPFNLSPMSLNKSVDGLATIGEESPPVTLAGPGMLDNPSGLSGFAALDMNLDWLTQQNGGQFDPQLFGDYREPQENVLNYGFSGKALFDALDGADFIAQFNQPPVMPELVYKPNDLIAKIDAQKESDDLPVNDDNTKLPCNQLWDTLQKCPKVQAGEFDLDSLCNELSKKATCGGKGPVVAQVDFNTVLEKYLGKKCAEGFRQKKREEAQKNNAEAARSS